MPKDLKLTQHCHRALVDPDTGEYCGALRYVDITDDCPQVKAQQGRCTILYVQTFKRGITAHLWVQLYPGNEPAWRNFSPTKPVTSGFAHRRGDTSTAWHKWFKSGHHVYSGPSGYLRSDHIAGWARWLGLTKRQLHDHITKNRPSIVKAAA